MITQSQNKSLLLLHCVYLNPLLPESADSHLCEIGHLGSSLLGLVRPNNSNTAWQWQPVRPLAVSVPHSLNTTQQYATINQTLSHPKYFIYTYSFVLSPSATCFLHVFSPQPHSTDWVVSDYQMLNWWVNCALERKCSKLWTCCPVKMKCIPCAQHDALVKCHFFESLTFGWYIQIWKYVYTSLWMYCI